MAKVAVDACKQIKGIEATRSEEALLLQAECLYLSGRTSEFDTFFDEIDGVLKAKLSRVQLYEMRLMQLSGKSAHKEAVAVGLKITEILDQKIPTEKEDIIKKIPEALGEVAALMNGRSPSDLISLEPCTNEEMELLIKIQYRLQPDIHVSQQPELFALTVIQNLILTLKFGASQIADEVFIMYAVVIRGMLGDCKLSYEFGKLAMDWRVPSGGKPSSSVSFSFAWFVQPWMEQLEACEKNYLAVLLIC